MKSLFIFLVIVFLGLSFDRLNIFKYCIISSLLHEMGHIAAYRVFAGKWPEIKVSVFGISMKNNVTYNKYYVWILAAGPAVNIFLVLLSLILLHKSFSLKWYIFLLVNVILLVINIIPVYYADGGQILYSKSLLYQQKYKLISLITIFLLYVIVIYFTDDLISFIVFLFYFIINISNDI